MSQWDFPPKGGYEDFAVSLGVKRSEDNDELDYAPAAPGGGGEGRRQAGGGHGLHRCERRDGPSEDDGAGQTAGL